MCWVLSGNPLAMTAGIQTLKLLQQPETYSRLEAKAAVLEEGINDAAVKAGRDLTVTRIASMLTIFFTEKKIIDYESASRSDTGLFARFHNHLLSAGIYWPPSQFETAFVSLSHGTVDIQRTVDIIESALKEV